MKKRVGVFIGAVFLINTLSAQAAPKTYYQTTLTSASGLPYHFSIKSNNAVKQVATTDDIGPGISDQDIFYTGKFQYYIGSKKTAYQLNGTYNQTAKDFYKITTKKGTPSFVVQRSGEGTNRYAHRLYYMHAGKLKKVTSTFYGTYNVQYVAKNKLRIGYYDPQQRRGLVKVSYYEINVKTGKATLKKVTFQQHEKGFN